MDEVWWRILWLNPEPWSVGSISTGKRNGKFFSRMSPSPNLVAFQNAVREELADEEMLPPNFTKFTFFFFREQAKYLDAADRVRHRNQADATNLQKGLEDALQGILFDNDRNVRDIRSVIVEQGANVEPCIIIKAEPFDLDSIAFTDSILEQLNKATAYTAKVDNPWADPPDFF